MWFWSQWLILPTFRRFGLAAQNPSRMHDYQDSSNFLRFGSQWLVFLVFRGFRLTTQNPISMYVFSKLHAVVCDLEANGWFCLRLQRLPKHWLLPHVAPRRPVSVFCSVFRSVAAYSLQVAILILDRARYCVFKRVCTYLLVFARVCTCLHVIVRICIYCVFAFIVTYLHVFARI